MEKFLNKIICDDSLNIMRQLPDKYIDLVLTDPPYGMNFVSNRRNKKHNKIINDSENICFLINYFNEIKRIIKNDAHLYFFCSHHNIDFFKKEIEKIFNYKSILVWVKNNAGMGDLKNDYAPQHEFIIFANQGKKINGKRDSSVITEKRTNNFFHPTEKPVLLFTYLINKSSKEGDIILDPFAGSFTTAKACKEMKRNFICIEKEKKYCEIGEQRLKQQLLF